MIPKEGISVTSRSYVSVIGAVQARKQHQIATGNSGQLYEMRESNPLRNTKQFNFAGVSVFQLSSWGFSHQCCQILKEEMRRLGSVILEAAEATRVPADWALAVDEKVLLAG